MQTFLVTLLLLFVFRAHAVDEYMNAVDSSDNSLLIFLPTTGIMQLSGTAVIRTMSGTATAPGYSFRSETTSGLFSSAANTLNFSTNAERMRITSAGNVGIGTTTPASTLTVNGAIRTSQGIIFPDGSYLTTATTAATGMGSTTDLTFIADNDANGSGTMSFQTRGTTRMTIANTGNIGIGTTSPNTGAIMDLSSTTTWSSMIVPRDTTSNRPTTVTNGMLRYNTTDNKFEVYEAGGWAKLATEGFLRKTADESVNNNTFQNDNDFTFTAQANSVYTYTMSLSLDTTSGTPDFKFTFTLPSGTFTAMAGNFITNSSVTVTDVASGTSSGLVPLTNSVGQMVIIRGYLTIGSTGGTVTFRWSQNTTSAGNPVVVNQGSIFNWRRQ